MRKSAASRNPLFKLRAALLSLERIKLDILHFVRVGGSWQVLVLANEGLAAP